MCNIAKGLLTLGLQMGDRVAILATSRAEWVQCDLGILAAAGITVPVYPSSLPEQVAYILHNAEVTLAFVDTPGQLEKLLQVRAELPALRHIVLMDGQPPSPDPLILSLDGSDGPRYYRVRASRLARRTSTGSDPRP